MGKKRALLMGNEAIMRGAIEAGVQVVTGYPGTPSSEILASAIPFSKKLGIYVEWSVNEKVALEGAAMAALCGLRALVSMKNVGLNVASDALMVMNYIGIKGGLVIVTADDPSGISSQNEQDSRLYAKLAEIPGLEPSDPQEAKDITNVAFEISEKAKLPVLVRSVTRLSHSRGDVILGELPKKYGKPVLDKEVVRGDFYANSSYLPVPRHKRLHEKMDEIKSLIEKLPFNELSIRGEHLGIAAAGTAINYAKEAVGRLGLNNEVTLLKVATFNPLPEKLIKKFLKTVDKVLVLEESYPYLEEGLRMLSYGIDKNVVIMGRLTGDIPSEGELSPDIAIGTLAKMLGRKYVSASRKTLLKAKDIPPRTLNLCPGCPHMATFYAIKQAVHRVTGKNPRKASIICGDIGCYGLGLWPHYAMYHTFGCMGSSIGMACGFAHIFTQEPIISVIGDSTFFHAGIPALVNAVYNSAEITVVVLDNTTTAMTGFQPNPGTGLTAIGERTTRIMIEDIAKACKVPFVRVVDPYEVEDTIMTLEAAIKYNGLSMVVARRPCAQVALREARKKGIEVKPLKVDPEKCTGCKLCITQLLCPALIWKDGKAVIDDILCVGCGVCAQLCPFDAINPSL